LGSHDFPILDNHEVPILDNHIFSILDNHDFPILEDHEVPILDNHDFLILDNHDFLALDNHDFVVLDWIVRFVLILGFGYLSELWLGSSFCLRAYVSPAKISRRALTKSCQGTLGS